MALQETTIGYLQIVEYGPAGEAGSLFRSVPLDWPEVAAPVKRSTRQRRAIVRALADAVGPLTPQEVLEVAGQDQPRLGLATVYRNLAVLQEEGEVRSVELPGKATRFEPAGRGHHHHFQCGVCGGIFDLNSHCPVIALEGATLPGGFRVRGHELVLYGTCAACS